MEVGAGSLRQCRLWTAAIRLICYGQQGASRDPGTSAFVSDKRAPAASANTFPAGVNAAANGARPGYHYNTRLSVSGGGQCDVTVADQLDLFDCESSDQRLPHARANIFSSYTCQPDSYGRDFMPLDGGCATGFIHCIADRRSRGSNTNAQWVGWASQTFA